MLTFTDMGNVTQEVLDQQMSHISSAQHQAFCLLGKSKGGLALWSVAAGRGGGTRHRAGGLAELLSFIDAAA